MTDWFDQWQGRILLFQPMRGQDGMTEHVRGVHWAAAAWQDGARRGERWWREWISWVASGRLLASDVRWRRHRRRRRVARQTGTDRHRTVIVRKKASDLLWQVRGRYIGGQRRPFNTCDAVSQSEALWMAGWPRLRPRRLPWPESGAVEDNYAAMVGGGAERAQPARSRDVQQLPRRALHTRWYLQRKSTSNDAWDSHTALWDSHSPKFRERW